MELVTSAAASVAPALSPQRGAAPECSVILWSLLGLRGYALDARAHRRLSHTERRLKANLQAACDSG